MNVIPLSSFHAEVIAHIHKDAFDEHWSTDEFSNLITLPATFGFLYQTDGQPLGFILCQGDALEAEIITIATHLNARRQGVGRQLIKTAFDESIRLYLEVAQDNSVARQFYRNMGFLQVGLRKKYYKRNGKASVDALVLSLSATDK
ncbi:MAG: GNAT family N-acetyltransferase [Methylocystaceae bacterium]|nr:GNAT family N-acetyltransferase [Methylocystaceae bacterium]